MLLKPIATRLTLIAMLAIFSLAVSFAATETPAMSQQNQADCSKVKDSKIDKEVVKSLRKNFNEEERLFLNFNITTNKGVVKLKGGVPGQTIFDRVIKAVKEVPCVKDVDTTEFNNTRQQKCDPPDQPCNGGCIGDRERCTKIG